MAIATNSIERTPKNQGTITSRWLVNASSADASGAEEIKEAPGDGYELVIRRLRIAIGGNVTVTLGSAELSSGVKTTLVGPIGGAAMAIDLDFGEDCLVLEPNSSFVIDASGAAVVWVLAEGLTRVCESAGIASVTPSASPSASPSSSASA
jgi:hypothetical protein